MASVSRVLVTCQRAVLLREMIRRSVRQLADGGWAQVGAYGVGRLRFAPPRVIRAFAGRSAALVLRTLIGQSVPVRPLDGSNNGSDAGALLALFGAIASRDRTEVARGLDTQIRLASRPISVGASRQDSDGYFLAAIGHYVYAGDTALHIAAAAYQREVAEWLVARGADVRARNRRGAEPLHYAADGGPDAEHWDPVAQREVIA